MIDLPLGAPRISNATGIVLAFLIVHFATASSAFITYRFHRNFPEFDNGAIDNKNRLEDYMPGKWRDVPSEPRPPQIDIHLLKGHILPENENWGISVEYKISSNKFENMDSVNREQNYEKEMNKEDGARVKVNEVPLENPQDNEVHSEPKLTFRRILTAPSYCPAGQRKDPHGKCRPVMNP